MRHVLLILIGLGILLVVGGCYVIFDADVMVDAPIVRHLGRKLKWPGTWGTDGERCHFRPDHEQWQSNLMGAGFGLVCIGAGVAAVSAWQLMKKSTQFFVLSEEGFSVDDELRG